MEKWTPAAIKSIRERYGETQEQFAKRLRVNVGTLRNWEQPKTKHRPPGPATLALDVLLLLCGADDERDC